MRSKTDSLCKVQVGPNSGPVRGRDFDLDPCLAWVQRDQKAATKVARFCAHFTISLRCTVSPNHSPFEVCHVYGVLL